MPTINANVAPYYRYSRNITGIIRLPNNYQTNCDSILPFVKFKAMLSNSLLLQSNKKKKNLTDTKEKEKKFPNVYN